MTTTTGATIEVDAVACGPRGLERAFGPSSWAIEVEGGRIADVSERSPAPGRLRVALPPLVNAHDHGRGLGTQHDGVRDAPLDPWIADFVARATPDSQYDHVHTALAQMRDCGVTGVVICVNPTTDDRASEVREAARAAEDTGMRVGLAYPISGGPVGWYREDRHRGPAEAAQVDGCLDRIDHLADEIETDRLAVLYHPVGPQWVSETVLGKVAERSRATGRSVHIHLMETPRQRRWADDLYPEGLIEALDGMDLLSERLWVAHGTHLRSEELALLARRGCGIAVNVSSNLRLASGVPPVGLIHTYAGDRMAPGLDGMTLEDDLDMWRELRLLRGLWQGQLGATVPASEILAAATGASSRASALGRAGPRAVQLGGLADLVVHDLSGWVHLAGSPAWPVEEIALAAASGATVSEVWCDGRRIDNGEARA